MKPASSALATHIVGEVTTLCTCWKVTRTDGVVLGFTDHDRDVPLGGVTFAAGTGYTPTAIDISADLAASNLEVEVVLDSAGITDTDLRAGLYDHAEVEVLLVNWSAPGDGAVVLSRGHLGEVKLDGPAATAEVRGLTQAFATNIGEYFSADCRASLGDSRCGIDLAGLTVSGTVVAVASRRSFTMNTSLAAGLHIGGMVAFTSGACAGLKMEVKSTEGAGVTLFMPMPRAIATGDAFTLLPGCDRSVATCRDRFANLVNFRGEPFVPGQDKAMEYPDARSG